MNLYAVTIRGFKYYFSGDLSLQAIQASENFCLTLKKDANSFDTNILFERLLSYIDSELGLSVTPVNIEHIFRVNY